MIELAHLVAVVCNQVQEAEGLIRGLHVDVDLPSEMRLLIHDVASAEPAQIDVLVLVLIVLDLKEALFGFFVFASRGRGDTEVPVEVIIVEEVGSDRFEIDEDIIELLQDEEA